MADILGIRLSKLANLERSPARWGRTVAISRRRAVLIACLPVVAGATALLIWILWVRPPHTAGLIALAVGILGGSLGLLVSQALTIVEQLRQAEYPPKQDS